MIRPHLRRLFAVAALGALIALPVGAQSDDDEAPPPKLDTNCLQKCAAKFQECRKPCKGDATCDAKCAEKFEACTKACGLDG